MQRHWTNSMLAAFRAHAPTLAAARAHRGWSRLVSDIARLLVEMPLWKLQRVGPVERLDFLYEEKLVDGAIVLRPGVAAAFQRQFTIVQALVQMAWITFVQKLPPNRALLGMTGDLAEFLFGAERAGLRAIVEGLTDLQEGVCFYCARAMRESVAVDHFIPWARYPRDLGHNFVLVHATCNQHKRDMLAGPAHLERWVWRTAEHGPRLQEIFDAARFVFDADASMSVAEWSYENAERAGALVWVKGSETLRLSNEWRRAFSS
jgi:5-methylcytosine-specific restriction endonuclease McrA